MSVSELPTASAVSMDVLAKRGADRLRETGDDSASAVEEIDIAAILAAAKSLDASDLFKLIKECTKEAEKRMKHAEKSTPAKRVAKKAGSAPKGKTPRQLRKNNAWVAFTLKDAQENGWEAFVVNSSRKDKETGETISEEIEMPASVLHEGAHIYKDSVTSTTPAGRQIIHKEAMSLSKQRKESHPSWEKFLATYEEEPASETESVAAKSTTSSKVTVRKTAAEKAAEKAEKDAAKEKEKAEKAAARELKKAEREVKKALEDQAKAERKAEREAKKAEKEAEAAKAKAEKEAAKSAKVTKTTVVKAKAAPVKAGAAAKAEPVVKAAGGAGAKKPVVVEEWIAPKEEGAVKAWSFKGKVYLRNSDNEIWLKAADGGLGEWQGVYITAEDRIDDSVSEPVFDEE